MRKGLVSIIVVGLVAACSGTPEEPAPQPTSPPAPTLATDAPATTAATTTQGPGTATSSSTSVASSTAAPPPDDLQTRLLGIGDEYYPLLGNPGYDVQHYDLALRFDPLENFLSAEATITAVATDDLRTFNLDFDTEQMTIDAVRVDGTSAQFAAAEEELTIRPAEAVAGSAEFTVEVDYFGNPQPEPTEALPVDVGWFTSADGSEAFVVGEPDAAHSWFPSNDHPLDKATYTFEITAPRELIAAANGTLVSTVSDDEDTATWRWEMDEPMAAYLATVVIGEFEIVRDDAASETAGVTIRHVLPRGTTIADWPGLERQGEMIALLEDRFGPYPFDTYGIAIVDGFRNALENQTLSIFGRRFTDPQIFERVLIHEVAHQWFGDSVSVGLWRDIWLNEGFASYAEWLWIEHDRGRAVVEDNIAAERDFLADDDLRPPGDPLATELFNQSVYRVGAMTLHALRLTVGDRAFFEILRSYHQQFAGGTATTDDFITVAETISGMELRDLFDSWLYGEGIPEFPAG